VPQCDDGSGRASVDEIVPLVEHETAFLDALDQGGTQGEPQETAGYTYEITFGSRSFAWRTCSGVAGVECLPPGPIERLIDALTRIQAENSCEIPSGGECSLPWADDGDCDAAIPSWWHDPATGACAFRASFEDCQAACPPPQSQDDCGADRQLREVCVECGLGGGCMKTQEVCARECASDGDCMGELNAYGQNATCDVAQGVCYSLATGASSWRAGRGLSRPSQRRTRATPWSALT
jgi:hypothetical protein